MSGAPLDNAAADTDSAGRLLEILAGKCRAQAVSTAAALGLADRLAAGPRTATALAAELDCDAVALGRLLAVLADLGVCEESPASGFTLTPLGQQLRGDALGPLAAFLGAPEQWDPWSRLRDALRTGGGIAFERTFGKPLYAFLAADDDAARRYDAAIDAFTRHEMAALRPHIDLAGLGTLVDVGGGRGTLLCALLDQWPGLRGVLFDLPHVIARSGPHCASRHGPRIDAVAGSFLERVPAGGDAYLLQRVLHNWDDDDARTILQHCAAALAPGGRVLVIEGLLAPGAAVSATRCLDLDMLVLTNGRQRRKPEFRRLFREAGLTLERTVRLTSSSYLLVGSPRAGGSRAG